MIKKILSNPVYSFGLIALISFIALSAALISEAFFGLEPCNLCIYQRYPFAFGLVIGLIGIALRERHSVVRAFLGISSLNFLVNSGIAAYHTGVEQKWWDSALEGCKVPLFFDDTSDQSILENLMSAPAASCSDIQWTDPILGLSMANYNIALCLGLFAFCGLSALMVKAVNQPTSSHQESA